MFQIPFPLQAAWQALPQTRPERCQRSKAATALLQAHPSEPEPSPFPGFASHCAAPCSPSSISPPGVPGSVTARESCVLSSGPGEVWRFVSLGETSRQKGRDVC